MVKSTQYVKIIILAMFQAASNWSCPPVPQEPRLHTQGKQQQRGVFLPESPKGTLDMPIDEHVLTVYPLPIRTKLLRISP